MTETETQPEEVAEVDAFQGESYTREGYAWAVDAFWAYEHLGDRMSRRKAETSSRWAMWQFAKKDNEKFLGTILPKAMTLLEKARDKSGDNDMIEKEERKGIESLKKILKAALVEALE